MFTNLEQFITNESGQGITKYGAILAFIAIIIVIVSNIIGSLQAALQNAFSTVSLQLNNLSAGS